MSVTAFPKSAQRIPKARKRLRPISDKRRDTFAERDRIRAEVFERDDYRCRLTAIGTPCFGPLTPHHVRKASAGGSYSPDNLLSACAHHNGWIEDHPIAAAALGLVIR